MLVVLILAMWLVATPAQPAPYKNVQVLADVPPDRLRATMDYVRASLGVQCWHCHVQGDLASDAKPAKVRAREMMRMVREINAGRFDGNLAVSCFTCHRGRLRPEVALPVFAGRPAADPPVPDAPLPAVEDVLHRYREGSGGEAAWRRLTTRVMTGTFESSEPASYPLEIFAASPDRYLLRYRVGPSTFADVRRGASAWRRENSGGRPITGRDFQALRARSDFAAPLTFADRYTRLQVLRRERAGAATMIVVAATTTAGVEELAYFDEASGLLQRIETRNVTPLGTIGERMTFEDYRRVDGVLLPFRVTRADAQFQYVQRIDEIRHNVPVDDSLFQVPAGPAPPPPQAADPKIDAAMRAINAALGVDCGFCHVAEDWKNESRDRFATARKMIQMVRVLNEGPLQGIGAVSCATCHGGQPRPSRLPIPALDAERAKWPASLAGHADRSMGMSVYNVTLGVGCDHCHDPADWRSDAKAPFRTAVRMAAMFDTFPAYMPATARTQCWMCHKGSTKPK